MLTITPFTLIIPLLIIGCGAPSEETVLLSQAKVETTAPLNISNSDILLAINKIRAMARDCHDGLGVVGPVAPLRWSETLYAAAYEHSNDLAQSNTFAHEGSGTIWDITGSNNGAPSLFNERIEANGYGEFYVVGENIAGGQESIEVAIQAWLDSPAHCTNLMSDKYHEVGVAVVVNPDADYEIYWTQNFGNRDGL